MLSCGDCWWHYVSLPKVYESSYFCNSRQNAHQLHPTCPHPIRLVALPEEHYHGSPSDCPLGGARGEGRLNCPSCLRLVFFLLLRLSRNRNYPFRTTPWFLTANYPEFVHGIRFAGVYKSTLLPLPRHNRACFLIVFSLFQVLGV